MKNKADGKTQNASKNVEVAKWTDFVLNGVRVWRPQRHTATQASLKCPPGMQETDKYWNVF